MKKSEKQIQLKLERVPRAAAAAILASSLSAFVTTGILGEKIEVTSVFLVMFLCAVFTAMIELAALPDPVLLGSCAVFVCAGGALFFIPFRETSIYASMKDGTDIPAVRILTVVLFLCGALCLAVCVLNRSFIVRCMIAGGFLIMLIIFIWLRVSLLAVPAILITAYILIVLCQVCTLMISPVSGTPREMWFILFSLITAVIVFSIPYPDTRIQWEKLFVIKHAEQFEQLGETLDIEPINDGIEKSESGYDEDQSSLGGWIDLVSDVRLKVDFYDVKHSDRLTGGLYDCYTGNGWVCNTEPHGTGYVTIAEVSPSDSRIVSGSDRYGCAGVSHIYKESDCVATQKSLFYPPYSHIVLSGDTEEAAVRDGMRLMFERSHSMSYKVYYYLQACEYEMTASEREGYLALPEELPDRVREMALAAVEGCSDDDSKAFALMSKLAECRYETRIDELPAGRDFVDYFLFDSKEGYCAYFASAMAVMARCVDIPSRYVQGYYIGSGNDLTVTVSSNNAHAWAELYIDGRWVIYDPTISSIDEITSDIADEAPESEAQQDSSSINRILFYSYVVIAAAVIVFIVFRPFFRQIPWFIKLKHKYGRSSAYPVIELCGRLLWVLSACDIRRDETETLIEFGVRIRKECEWLDEVTGEKIYSLFRQTSTAIYAPDGDVEYNGENIVRAVRKMYICKFGVMKYLRGYRRALL